MLNPSELADLGTWLRNCGFAVTNAQLIAAGRLLNGTRRFASREELAAYLAPLFCSDARMQQRFKQEYEAWLGQMGLADTNGLIATLEPSVLPALAKKTSPQSKIKKNHASLKRISYLLFSWPLRMLAEVERKFGQGIKGWKSWLAENTPQTIKKIWYATQELSFFLCFLLICTMLAVLILRNGWPFNDHLFIENAANRPGNAVASKFLSTPSQIEHEKVASPSKLQKSSNPTIEATPTLQASAGNLASDARVKLQADASTTTPTQNKVSSRPLSKLDIFYNIITLLLMFISTIIFSKEIFKIFGFFSPSVAIFMFLFSALPTFEFLTSVIIEITFLWWLFAKYNRDAFLEKLPADAISYSTLALIFPTQPLSLLSEQIKHIGPALRQRRRVHTREIDVIASVHATVRAGGIATPVFGSKQEPEYLLLVDRSSHHDHFAALADALVAALHAQGVWLERYQFDGDLQQLHHQPFANETPHTGPQTLSQLAKRHADARLIVFSDGAGLIDRYSSDVHANVMRLHAWPRPLLLTPHARAAWAAREWLLAHAGLQVLPMDEEGLSVLRHLYEARGDAPAVADETRNSLGPLFLHNQDLWLDRVAPPQAEIEGLLQALKGELGAAGFAWLAACAVYPEIHWGITLALGESLRYQTGTRQTWQLQSREQHAASLLQLAHLPWLRHGFMPAWLRQRLLAEIPADCHAHVRQELETLLQALAQTGTSGDLQVHTPSRWQQIWQRWRKPNVPEAANDKVFLSFMGGTRFALKLAGPLRRWLYPQGLPLAGPRGGPVFLALLLVGGLLALWPEKKEQPELLAQASVPLITPTPTASMQVPASSPSIAASASEPVPTPASASASASAQATPAPASQAASNLPAAIPSPASAQTAAASSAEQLSSAPTPTSSAASASDSASIAQSSAERNTTRCDFCPEMVIIPAGSFLMGGGKYEERPVRRVQVASFMLGKFEVTQAQWRAVMGRNPSFFKDCGDNCPVERVSWLDVQMYLQKLNALTGQHYRLPSEEEWEYAARAGSQSKRSHGNDEAQLANYAWYSKNSSNKTHTVGTKKANAFGLYDMHGNVWEWVAACLLSNNKGAPSDDVPWTMNCNKDNSMTRRGGSWISDEWISRLTESVKESPFYGNKDIGFRVARTLP